MNIKNIARIGVLILLIFILMSFSYKSYAATEHKVSKWYNIAAIENNRANDELQNLVRTPLSFILTLVRLVAVIVAICMMLWAAIRYMAPNFSLFGTVLDRAEVKRDIPRFVIGSVLLFGTSGLLTFVQYVIEDVVG